MSQNYSSSLSDHRGGPHPNSKSKFQTQLDGFLKQADLQAMVLPGILLIIVFSYFPMYGLVMSFQEYNLGDIPGFSKWVGLLHFQTFFQTPELNLIMRNTFAISFLKLLFCFPAPILLAILFNEVRGITFKKTVQTITYLPHFISWVVVAGLVFDILSVDGGIVNHVLQSLKLIDTPILFMGEPKYFWSIAVITDCWKEIGWNAIIYVAAIASIDPELYDAADIDGATRFRKIWHITLPGIRSTIVILLILSIGSILNSGFEQILLLTNNLQNTLVYETSEILDTYVYRVGIQGMRFSYASAVGLFKSVVNLVFLTVANFSAKSITGESLW